MYTLISNFICLAPLSHLFNLSTDLSSCREQHIFLSFNLKAQAAKVESRTAEIECEGNLWGALLPEIRADLEKTITPVSVESVGDQCMAAVVADTLHIKINYLTFPLAVTKTGEMKDNGLLFTARSYT